jgi:hypothetical protein
MSSGLLPDFYLLCFKNYILKKSGRIPVDSARISLESGESGPANMSGLVKSGIGAGVQQNAFCIEPDSHWSATGVCQTFSGPFCLQFW